MARTGRRPGNQDTREAILAAARKAFAEKGFDGASIRAIATSAGPKVIKMKSSDGGYFVTLRNESAVNTGDA